MFNSRGLPPGSENRATAGPRVLLLIPSYAKRGLEAEVAANTHPTMDYFALQAHLDADLADYSSMEADRHVLVRAARRLGRPPCTGSCVLGATT